MDFQFPPINTEVPPEKVKEVCLAFGLQALWDQIEADYPAKPFVSDGASCFPDKIGDVDLYPAAFLHDLKYWSGHKGDTKARFLADLELARDVVVLCGGSIALAETMLTGVRIGGSDDLPTPWAWGYGRQA